MVPSLVPHTSSELGVDAFELLVSVPLLFWGLFIGVFSGPRLAQSAGSQRVVHTATALVAMGLAMVTAAPSPGIFQTGALMVGLGFGVVEVLVTAQVRVESSQVAKSLTQLNAVFALGAVFSPLFLAATLSLLETDAFGYVVTLGLLLAGFAYRAAPTPRSPEVEGLNARPLRILFVACALYVGAESVLAGWTATMFSELEITTAELAPIGTTIFWGMLALGRIVSLTLTPKRLSLPAGLLVWPLLSAAGLAMTLFSSGAVLPMALGLALAAFGAGPVYGFLLAQGLELVKREQSAKASRALILAGAFGGFVIPLVLQFDPSVFAAAAVAMMAMLGVSLIGQAVSRNEVAEEKVRT